MQVKYSIFHDSILNTTSNKQQHPSANRASKKFCILRKDRDNIEAPIKSNKRTSSFNKSCFQKILYFKTRQWQYRSSHKLILFIKYWNPRQVYVKEANLNMVQLSDSSKSHTVDVRSTYARRVLKHFRSNLCTLMCPKII